MRFLADEDFPLPSVRLLSGAGHDVAAVILDSPGLPDEDVLDRASREHRILLTFDRDHGRLLYRQGAPVPEGVVYFRFDPSSPQEPASYLLDLLRYAEASLPGAFTVAARGRARRRSLPAP